jgi:hypothetical protein
VLFVTVVAVDAGVLLGGVVVVERVFQGRGSVSFYDAPANLTTRVAWVDGGGDDLVVVAIWWPTSSTGCSTRGSGCRARAAPCGVRIDSTVTWPTPARPRRRRRRARDEHARWRRVGAGQAESSDAGLPSAPSSTRAGASGGGRGGVPPAPARDGAGFLALIVLACFVGVHFAPSPTEQSLLEPTSGPSAAHWFGTDELSRDQLSRVLHGGQVSLKIAVGVAILTTIIGVIVGALAGFHRGWLDELLMRFTDLWIALPALPFLAVAVSIGSLDLGPFGTLDLGGPLADAPVVVAALGFDRARGAGCDARAARA